MQKKAKSINLVVGSGKNFVDKFIEWALNAGRLIVILTEFVALSAFLYRFSLDRTLIDLHSLITQEQNTVIYYKTYEDTYRNLQDRIALAKSLATQTQNQAQSLQDTIKLASNTVTFSSIALANNQIKISVQVRLLTSLSTFINSLKKYPKIQSVSINNIANNPSNGTITADIVATLKGATQ